MLFILTQKFFSYSTYLSFCLDFLVIYQNSLIKQIRLISNFMAPQSGQQTIVLHIMPNISRSKFNQTMKFSQLIGCNMRNIFLEKLYSKCGGETSSRPFSKKLKLTVSLDQWSKVFYSLFFIVWQVEGYQNILKLSNKPLAFTSY